MEREVVETRGDYRAVIIQDEDAYEPDYDGQAVVLRFDYRNEWNVDNLNGMSEGDDMARALKTFMDTYSSRKGWPVFERYARIFHGTRDIRKFHYSYSPDSAEYVALDSLAMRQEWGLEEDSEYAATGAEGTASDWQAYIDGDVYGIAVQRKRSYSTVTTYSDGSTEETSGVEWETVEDSEVWGHYGKEWAEQAAREALNDYAPLASQEH
jgi:hypothetical protein